MGRVDSMDLLLVFYRPSICGKKWYWPLFTNMLNISVVAVVSQCFFSICGKICIYIWKGPNHVYTAHVRYKSFLRIVAVVVTSHCATNKTMFLHLEFLRHITMTLLQNKTQKGSRTLKEATYPTPGLRYDRINHIPGTTMQVCKKNTK